MPGLVPTPLGEHMETAIDILGNRMRVAIIGYLRKAGPAQRSEIAEALSLVPSSVSNQLATLLSDGVIAADEPDGNPRPGARVRYVVVEARASELYRILGHALGEPGLNQ